MKFAWVAGRLYKVGAGPIADAIRTILSDPRVEADRSLIEKGLVILEAGGDFADGVIAFSSHTEDTFVTFDRKASLLLAKAGKPVILLRYREH